MAGRSPEQEQRVINFEVLMSRTREAAVRFDAMRLGRRQRLADVQERRWYRRELIAILGSAPTEREVADLGLSNEMVREARLGNTVKEAWARFGPGSPVFHGRESGGDRPPRVVKRRRAAGRMMRKPGRRDDGLHVPAVFCLARFGSLRCAAWRPPPRRRSPRSPASARRWRKR